MDGVAVQVDIERVTIRAVCGSERTEAGEGIGGNEGVETLLKIYRAILGELK